MTTPAGPAAAPLVLRDLVEALLRKQQAAVSADAVARALDYSNVGRVRAVLGELEAQGVAVRDRAPYRPFPDLWRTAG